MKIAWKFQIVPILSWIFPISIASQQLPEAIYVANYTDSQIYRVDPVTGISSLVTPTLIGMGGMHGGIVGVTDVSQSQLYTIGFNDGFAYSVNLQTGTFAPVSQAPIGSPGGPSDIAFGKGTTFYISQQTDQTISSLDIATGSSTVLATTLPDTPALNTLTISNNNIYTVGYNSTNIYTVNLTNNQLGVVPTNISSDFVLSGIVFAGNTPYLVCYDYNTNQINRLYEMDLSSSPANATLVAELSGSAPIGWFDLKVFEGIAYTAGESDNNVYAINLQTGVVKQLTSQPVGTLLLYNGLYGLGLLLPPPIPTVHTQGLHGSVLSFANYLNAVAPLSTLRLFDSLRGSELTQALEAAMPVRNGFQTFAAQNGYLASSQVVTDHLYQKRITRKKRNNLQTAALNSSQEELLAYASDRTIGIKRSKKSTASPCEQGFVSAWIGGFGELAREKAQTQTPGFTASLGGTVLGVDYNCVNNNVVGIGGAYAYTHVHEKEGTGHANVNQGFLELYGTLHMEKWYFDLSAWGGYYHTNNHRNISFPGFHKTASSTTHGWQVAPHFEVGYDEYFPNFCHMKQFGVGPFLLADWVASWEHGFSEHGAGELNMRQKGKFCSLFRGETGLRLYETISYGWGQIVFQEKGSYAYQKMFHSGAVTALLIGAPSSITLTTLTSAQNLGVGEFSILFMPSNQKIPYFEIRYQGEFGSKYQSHQGIVEIGKDF